MRLFTHLVFDQFIYGNAEVVSPPEHHDLLGKAHDLVYEVEVELPFRAVVTTPGPFAAIGQVTAQLAGTGASARVRIWVTGWSA